MKVYYTHTLTQIQHSNICVCMIECAIPYRCGLFTYIHTLRRVYTFFLFRFVIFNIKTFTHIILCGTYH
uniref:Uncharacterized protein n=1 Tax=Octopus bimaculoides TaxID=37653 RepID=A0A0L8ICE6_OCTBM